MDIRLLRGAEIEPHIDDLARLRIQVFREFPYLYDGNLDYEAEYLATYVRSADSLCVLVCDEGRVVGASTALPLADETEEFQQPFIAAGWSPARIFYCAESVVLPAWLAGLGMAFSSLAVVLNAARLLRWPAMAELKEKGPSASASITQPAMVSEAPGT